MLRKLTLAAAMIAGTAVYAVSADAQPSADSEASGQWRVVVQTRTFTSIYGAIAGLDSYPIIGDVEDCRRIARANGVSFPLDGRSKVTTFCLDTTTGIIEEVGAWKP